MRTSLAVPAEILRPFDETWEREGLDSRSRAIREAMSEYVERHRTIEDLQGDVVGLVAFDYVHDRVVERLHELQHDYQDVIVSTSHSHQDAWCLETLFVEGSAERIRQLIYRLMNFDDVRRVRPMFL